MVKSVNWAALKKTREYVIKDEGDTDADAVAITLRKRGVLRIINEIARVPLLGEAIEAIADRELGKPKKVAVSTTDAVLTAVATAAEDNDTSKGKAVRDLITNLPSVLIDVLVEDTVLASEDEAPAYREWLESLGPSGMLNVVTAWIGFNLPEFKQPFTEAVAALLFQGKKALADVKAKAAAADPAPTAPEAEGQERLAA